MHASEVRELTTKKTFCRADTIFGKIKKAAKAGRFSVLITKSGVYPNNNLDLFVSTYEKLGYDVYFFKSYNTNRDETCIVISW